MIEQPSPPEVSLRGSFAFLMVGLVPLAMLIAFWSRSGTGLSFLLAAYTMLLGASFLMALNYYLWYRQHLPRSVPVPAGIAKGLVVAALLLPTGTYSMLATSSGVALTLSPGPKIELGQALPVAVKVVTAAVSPGLVSPLKLPPHPKLDLQKNRWLLNKPFLNGALWGALGYALAFGIAGLLLGLMRSETTDPRDEQMATGFAGVLMRGTVGLYYGSSVGFALGTVIIWIMRFLFPAPAQTTPTAVLHWIYVMGAASNPNVAFAYAFSTACLLAGALSLVSGRRDFTAQISDPKAPEITRPIAVNIPPIHEAPQQGFDMGRVAQESQQIIAQFQGELGRMFNGSEWEYERYDLPPVGKGGKPAEPEATNLISARELPPDDELSAMGSLSNVYVQIVADLGTLEIPAADWLCLAEGAILELPKAPDSTINVSINGKPAGKGRPLTINGNKGVKMVQLRANVEQLAQQGMQ